MAGAEHHAFAVGLDLDLSRRRRQGQAWLPGQDTEHHGLRLIAIEPRQQHVAPDVAPVELHDAACPTRDRLARGRAKHQRGRAVFGQTDQAGGGAGGRPAAPGGRGGGCLPDQRAQQVRFGPGVATRRVGGWLHDVFRATHGRSSPARA